jgi:hypothetical protein
MNMKFLYLMILILCCGMVDDLQPYDFYYLCIWIKVCSCQEWIHMFLGIKHWNIKKQKCLITSMELNIKLWKT